MTEKEKDSWKPPHKVVICSRCPSSTKEPDGICLLCKRQENNGEDHPEEAVTGISASG